MTTMQKLRRIIDGKLEIMSDADLDLIAKFDVSNLVRSRPNPSQVGTLDRWECWIERKDLVRFNSLDEMFADGTAIAKAEGKR